MRRAALWLAAAALLCPLLLAGSTGSASAQSLLERTPNLEGVWNAPAWRLHFHVMHRFTVLDPPVRKVLNTPTVLAGLSGPARTAAGVRYASNSALVAAEPNEWELFARWSPLVAGGDAPGIGLAVQGGRNVTAESFDGEAVATAELGRVRVLGGARAFSALAGGEGGAALVGGAGIALTRHLALAADVGWLVGVDSLRTGAGEVDTGAPVWSAGFHARIPYTPHTLSLHASNAATTTLQGASIPGDEVRYGFEFTVPLTLSRYFGGRSGTAGQSVTAGPSPPGAAVVVEMDNALRYLPATVTVRVGETVTWRNTSEVVHTVTADPEKAAQASNASLPEGATPFDSGDLAPGEAFSYTFRTPGTYRYFCIPHELAGLVGTVVVEGPAGSQDAGR